MVRVANALAGLALVACSFLLVAQGNRPAKKASTGNAEAGAEVFQHNCVMCHSSEPEIKIVGPSLYHVMKGPHAWSPSAVREITSKGKGMMPSFHDKLTDQQIADLLAHLRTL